MKKIFLFLSAVALSATAYAQSGNQQLVVSEVQCLPTSGDNEQLLVRLSGQGAGSVSALAVEFEAGSRYGTLPMTCLDCGGGNGTSLWTLSVDVDPMLDAKGETGVVFKADADIVVKRVTIKKKNVAAH